MSKKLIILGNTNLDTFFRCVILASRNLKKKEGDKDSKIEFKEIVILHSKESFSLLAKNEDFFKILENEEINRNVFTHKVIDYNTFGEREYIEFMESWLKESNMDDIYIELTNGTTEGKAFLTTIGYLLNIKNIYYLDYFQFKEENMEQANKKNSEAWEDAKSIDLKYYKKFYNNKSIDKLGYLNLIEIVRYNDIIEDLTKSYGKLDVKYKDEEFFKQNLVQTIKLKLESDMIEGSKKNVRCRMASSSIASSVENLVEIIAYGDDFERKGKKTLGNKIKALESKIRKNKCDDFDMEFCETLNNFVLYLRNSTTHKNGKLNNIEKYRADLSVKLSIVLLDYYFNIIEEEIQFAKEEKNNNKYLSLDNNGTKHMYFGLDGDDTGSYLESLFWEDSVVKIEEFSKKIANGRKKITEEIKNNNGKIIFAEGDDILFSGKFTKKFLKKLQDIYVKETDGVTCSIGFGESLRAVYLGMKKAKGKIKKNGLSGIKILCDTENNFN